MPKPASRSELLTASNEAFQTLEALLAALTESQLAAEFPFPHRDRNVRDVLAHLYEWQQMFFAWYKVGMSGNQPLMPAPGFTWRETPELNQQIWQQYQSLALAEIRAKLKRSHNKLQKLIQTHSNEELFTKRRYSWTGTTSLGAYITSAGWSHYHWALKLMRRVVARR
ncbi:MAG: ClbS/DfsB family four-helix bundle protein [Planctomycetaceae bacterium]|nr:ClbS/DfsB family four-helix bundle protein [Planctomycetaceae bacterium]